MKRAVIFIAEGFEEIEALSIVDILRRGGVEVNMMSVSDNPYVTGVHGIEIVTNSVSEFELTDEDMIILPGGLPGADNLRKSAVACETIKYFATHNRFIAAICAAPYVLGQLGILKGKKATCYPGFQEHLIGADYTAAKVEIDGNIITANGPASASKFALTLLECLEGKNKSCQIAEGMLLK